MGLVRGRVGGWRGLQLQIISGDIHVAGQVQELQQGMF